MGCARLAAERQPAGRSDDGTSLRRADATRYGVSGALCARSPSLPDARRCEGQRCATGEQERVATWRIRSQCNCGPAQGARADRAAGSGVVEPVTSRVRPGTRPLPATSARCSGRPAPYRGCVPGSENATTAGKGDAGDANAGRGEQGQRQVKLIAFRPTCRRPTGPGSLAAHAVGGLSSPHGQAASGKDSREKDRHRLPRD